MCYYFVDIIKVEGFDVDNIWQNKKIKKSKKTKNLMMIFQITF